MLKPKNRVANSLALLFVISFAAGVVHAAEPEATTKTVTTKMAEPMADNKASPPPTIDTNKDGKADAWDRDANGIPDAWDMNDDGKPDVLDNNGDGKPDEEKAPTPPPFENAEQPENR
jgi:hypothetical protein